jgi:hypothetical protein
MNQGIIWTAVAVIVLLAVGFFAWNVLQQPAGEPLSPQLQEATIDDRETAAPTLPPTAVPLVSSLNVSPQPAGSSSVSIDSAVLAQSGFIVIHADSSGKPGTVIGNTDLLEAGAYRDTPVTLTRRTRKDETLHAMLHTDADGDGAYKFPGPDEATTDSGGAAVTVPFTVSSQSPSPAASPTPATTTAPATPATY